MDSKNLTVLAAVIAVIFLLMYAQGNRGGEAVEKPKPTEHVEVTPTTTSLIPDEEYEMCMEMEDGQERDQCVYDIALKTKDRRKCSDIDYYNLKYRCRAKIESNPLFCKKVDVLREKDWCYYTIAYSMNNVSYCDDIFHSDIKDKCIFGFVMDKKPDPARCFDIVNSSYRDRCIFKHIGLKTPAGKRLISETLCKLIVDPDLELRCNQTYGGG